MIRLAGIDHVVFRVRNVEAMVHFYQDVLGAHVEREVADVGLIQLRAGNSLIDLFDADGKLGRMGGVPPGPEGRNVDHVCLAVEDWDDDAIMAHLAAHGFRDAEISRRYGAGGMGPSIYIADPEGNTIELKGPSD